MKCNHVRATRLNWREVVGETEMLARRLSRKRETCALSVGVIFVDDQVVAGRLAMKVTVNRARHEQAFAFAALLQFFIDRPYMFRHQRLIFFRGFSALLELPLTFEERGFIDEGEDVV